MFRICLVTSEVTPFAKTGGLADVAAGLSRDLAAAGHDVRVFMPLYARVHAGGWKLVRSQEIGSVDLQFGDRRLSFDVWTAAVPDRGADGEGTAVVYFVNCPELFDREHLYTNDGDEPLRFTLLTRATLESCQRMQWGPDVFHCNDWHTGLLPLLLRTNYAWDQLFSHSKSLLTIHNIGYQGNFGAGTLADLGLMDLRRHFPQDSLDSGQISFLETGLVHADAVSTVSRTYAREIQTPEFGMGLDGVLRSRSESLFGIVNGVDYSDWNPETDPLIPHNYTADDLSGKLEVKRELLSRFQLGFAQEVPVIGVVSRLTGQKGFDLLPDILPVLLQNLDIRFVVLGSGESSHEQYFQWLRDTYPSKVANYRGYNNDLAHWIEAGADMFLMPSRYEPCGLNQMYSLRYGTVPIVRRTGGLADTVEHFDANAGTGTGFLFGDFDSRALYDTIREALSVWADPPAWARLVRNGMAQDFSWARQGREYERVYALLTERDE